MNPKEIFEKQYGEKKLVSVTSFSFLRKRFKAFDLNRENLVVSLLDGGESLLDVGCGNGLLMFRVKKKFNELYGVDISPSRIQESQKIAKQKFPNDNGLHFSTCDINEGIGFQNEMFDAVTCIATLQYLYDPYFVIGEINRILKTKGIFILEVPNIAYLKYRIQLLFGKLPRTSSAINWEEIGWDAGSLHYFTKKSLRKLLEGSGFKIVKVSGSGLFPQFRNWWSSLLTGDLCIKVIKE